MIVPIVGHDIEVMRRAIKRMESVDPREIKRVAAALARQIRAIDKQARR